MHAPLQRNAQTDLCQITVRAVAGAVDRAGLQHDVRIPALVGELLAGRGRSLPGRCRGSRETRSRGCGRTAGVGSVKGPSPEHPAMTRMRRFRTFPSSPRNGELRPFSDLQLSHQITQPNPQETFSSHRRKATGYGHSSGIPALRKPARKTLSNWAWTAGVFRSPLALTRAIVV